MIFNLPPSVQLSVCTEPTDMRNYAVPAVMQSATSTDVPPEATTAISLRITPTPVSWDEASRVVCRAP
jgi:hypothetical protein